MTADTLSFTAAFLVGLLGGAHCIGMCGGITGAFGLNTQGSLTNRLIKTLSFNSGRILSYTFAGFIIGLISTAFSSLNPMVGMILRLIAGVFIILMGLYIADWSRAITFVEKAGQGLWKLIQPLTKPFLPADTVKKSVVLGLLWGWLPCGLVYSTLVLASAASTPIDSAMIMLAFGLGTLPAMLTTGVLASQLSTFIRHKQVRNLAAIMMIIMGGWIILGNSQHLIGHGDHSSHHENIDHSKMDHSQTNNSEIDHSQMDHSKMGH